MNFDNPLEDQTEQTVDTTKQVARVENARVEDPASEYGDVATLLLVEHLDENYDQVEEQLKEIRALLEKSVQLNQEHKAEDRKSVV